MKQESCYGIIPLRKICGVWQVFIVSHKAGDFWGFPKGHAEPGEAPKESATRELFEETGLQIKQFLSEDLLEESYEFTRKGALIHKKVGYFLAEVEGQENLLEAELSAGKWVPLSQASGILTFEESRSVCTSALSYLEPHAI